MAEYLKQKIPTPSTTNGEDFLDRERSFTEQLKNLVSSKPEMVNDFQNPVTKDLSVQKINTVGDVQPIKTEAQFRAAQIMRNAESAARKGAVEQVANTLDYNQLKKEFAQKARSAAKVGGKKLLGAIPLIGGIAQAISSQDASAAVPFLGDSETLGPQVGSIDDRIEKGTLTDADKQLLQQQQARLQALQKLR